MLYRLSYAPHLGDCHVLDVSIVACQSGSDGFSDGSTNDEAPDVAMVRSLMEGLGAVDAKTDKKIEYTPRAPLAMPSKVDTLPPPEEREVVASGHALRACHSHVRVVRM